MKFKAIRALLYGVGLLPRSLIGWFCDLLGAALYRLLPKQRQLVERQLREVFGDAWSEARIRKTARAVFQHQLKVAADFCWMLTVSSARLSRNFDVHHKERVINPLKKGKGAILVSFHLGPYTIAPAGAASEGDPISVVYKPQRSTLWERMVLFAWQKKGVELVPRGPSSKDDYEGILRRNRIFTTAIDQDTGGKTGVFIDFLGKPASAYCGFVLMAHRFGAPIIPVACIRRRDGTGVVYHHRPIHVRLRDPHDPQEIARAVERVSKTLERHVRRFPEQWLWTYRRWRTPPPK